MIKLAISGCLGRMGQRITALAQADKDFQIETLLERADHPGCQQPAGGKAISISPEAVAVCDVLIDFTAPQATMDNLKACVQNGVALVIGTTGLSADQIQAIQRASQKIPIVFSSNMSVGVNIFFELARALAAKIPSNYEMRMVEAHHIHKKDAPSGTAKTITEIIEKASGRKVAGIESIREGEIVGDHKVIFESGEDIITIDHHAKDRDIFAKGALVAAKFLAGRKDGLFTMQDVLGLNAPAAANQ